MDKGNGLLSNSAAADAEWTEKLQRAGDIESRLACVTNEVGGLIYKAAEAIQEERQLTQLFGKAKAAPELARELKKQGIVKTVLDSNYFELANGLHIAINKNALAEKPYIDEARQNFACYYFAVHPGIRPSGYFQISEEKIKTIQTQFLSFYEYFEEHFQNYNADLDEVKTIDVVMIAALIVWTRKRKPEGYCLPESTDFEGQIDADADAADRAPADFIQSLRSIRINKTLMSISKLANAMTKDVVDAGEIALKVSKEGAKKIIKTSFVLTYAGDKVEISGRQKYTEYDRNVYDAVASLYVYGDKSHVMTPAMVYRAMTLTDTENPSAKQLADIRRSLDKMRFIHAKIDCTAELQARQLNINSEQINSGQISTYLLAAKEVKIRAGGQLIEAYKILDVPILYEYSSALNQVLEVPALVVNVCELNEDGSIGARLPNTDMRIRIKGYLIRRIEGMKGKNSLNSRVIALQDYVKNGETHAGLYSIAGKPDAKDIEARRIRSDVERMLAYWVKTQYINGYKRQTQGKKITGYEITLNEKAG